MKLLILASLFWSSNLLAAETVTCSIRQSSFDCLLCNCYHEARGESRDGKIAVLKTVLSRMEDRRFPSTACGVVFQRSQFSWTSKRSPNISVSKPEDRQSLNDCREAVNTALNEGPNGILYFYNEDAVTPAWLSVTSKCGKIDDHVFLVPRGASCPRSIGANTRSGSNNGRNNTQQRPAGTTR